MWFVLIIMASERGYRRTGQTFGNDSEVSRKASSSSKMKLEASVEVEGSTQTHWRRRRWHELQLGCWPLHRILDCGHATHALRWAFGGARWPPWICMWREKTCRPSKGRWQTSQWYRALRQDADDDDDVDEQ